MDSMRDARGYDGPERRRNRLFITRNSEYYCRDGYCVVVRNRRTGALSREHSAVGKRMTGAMRFNDEGGIAEISSPDALHAGEQLCFSAGRDGLEHDVITSPLLAIERPPKDVVNCYVSS